MALLRKRAETLDDGAIVALYWQRDERAIQETDVKYRGFLLSIARNFVRDLRDGEECLNDTYIGAWNAIPPSRPSHLQAFLATIMRRVAINRYNANQRQKRSASEFAISLSELEELVADRGDVHAELEAKELALLIGRFVRGLPERQLYVFIGRYYLAQPLAKIAEELGCGISTVKRELAVIKGKLKEYLEREGYCL